MEGEAYGEIVSWPTVGRNLESQPLRAKRLAAGASLSAFPFRLRLFPYPFPYGQGLEGRERIIRGKLGVAAAGSLFSFSFLSFSLTAWPSARRRRRR